MSSDNDDFDPVYQSGRSAVEHKNLDAAGESHPLGDEPLSFDADLKVLIRELADKIYQSWEDTIREYLANAETATLRTRNFVDPDRTEPTVNVDSLYGVDDGYEPLVEVTWDKSENRVTIRDNGIGMASREVDEVFRKIGNSTARDEGNYSGQFGMGVLSFGQLIGTDNSMIMTTHSRQTDENFSSYISLAGPEPLMGSMPDDQYGTKFQMNPKGDYDIREAVERYAENMRVTVLYREYDETGEEVFNEEWGDKSLKDDYRPEMITLEYVEPGAFEAYSTAEASEETLLLSMPIERSGPSSTKAPFPMDVRLLDESGKVIRSSNGNEGLMPCTRSRYRSMLLEAREPYITESFLSGDDVVAQAVAEGPNEGAMVVAEAVLESDQPLPPNEYITRDDLADDDQPGDARVIFGSNKGRIVVSEAEWDELDEGRASKYVPEDELEPFDLDTGEGDLTLPEPTTDRDRLQSNEVFWKWLGLTFKEQFQSRVVNVFTKINQADDPLQKVLDMDADEIVKDVQAVSGD